MILFCVKCEKTRAWAGHAIGQNMPHCDKHPETRMLDTARLPLTVVQILREIDQRDEVCKDEWEIALECEDDDAASHLAARRGELHDLKTWILDSLTPA